jgi:hypothetical protein
MEMVGSGREGGQSRVWSQSFQGDSRESRIRRRAPVDKTPVNGVTKIFGNILETELVDLGRFGSKFCQRGDGVANVRSSGDISKQQFTK